MGDSSKMFLANLKLKSKIIEALIANAEGNIKKHKANVDVYLENPAGIGDHSDILGAIRNEIQLIAKEEEIINLLKKYF